ncbi:hypothetical protein HW555_012254 [Spodoptera exigua]|uniref:Uncharacterized protein n=1 Tax=Spodoptera exigua TaxID=7107 RepID=A0A835KZT7_SPOEX|nr:hypothetical protein HW555_012254 [Spodoptera exigua]
MIVLNNRPAEQQNPNDAVDRVERRQRVVDSASDVGVAARGGALRRGAARGAGVAGGARAGARALRTLEIWVLFNERSITIHVPSATITDRLAFLD